MAREAEKRQPTKGEIVDGLLGRRDVRTSEPRARGPVTQLLLVTNVAVYIAMVGYARSVVAALRIPEGALLWFGANDVVVTVGDNRVETLLTACFLHGSLLHIVFNMYVLRQVGPFLEESIGRARFLPLYLVSGVAGSVASALVGYLTSPRVSVGASGAVCGLVAAAMVLGLRTGGMKSPVARGMAGWLVMTLILGFVSRFDASLFGRVDNEAHVGGAIAGAAVAALWRRGKVYSAMGERFVIGVSVAVIVLSGAVVAYRDLFDPFVHLRDKESRLRVATAALWSGRCADAKVAVERARGLDPKARETAVVAAEIGVRCGR